MRDKIEPGYAETFMRLGLNNHFGLQEANATPWLGMPEFPYFASPTDFRKVHQGRGGTVVAHQWDFCGSFHFLGPVNSLYDVSKGNWEMPRKCLNEAMREAQNMAELSGHPAFFMPLYEALGRQYDYVAQGDWDPEFRKNYNGKHMFRFIEDYQRLLCFEFTKRYRLAFARSIDIADYYRRHFEVTPRTVMVSKTDHVLHEVGWLCTYNDYRELIPRERIPWLTRISSVLKERRETETRPQYYKDPLSCEFILIEDQARSIRFERESPNPVWWFDYTQQERGPQGSTISHVETPDVVVLRTGWKKDQTGVTMGLKMVTRAEFPNYAIALWGLPAEFGSNPDASRIETNAKQFILARNTDGELHLVLFFDLVPQAELQVTLHQP